MLLNFEQAWVLVLVHVHVHGKCGDISFESCME